MAPLGTRKVKGRGVAAPSGLIWSIGHLPLVLGAILRIPGLPASDSGTMNPCRNVPVMVVMPAMSFATIRSFAFSGIEAVPVEVQVQISSGLPAFLVVGLPDKAVGEARERVRAALTAMGLSLPPRRVLINLAPADLLKEGSHFDLPHRAGACWRRWTCCRARICRRYAALGELSLDGSLNPVAGVLPAAIAASARGAGADLPGEPGRRGGLGGHASRCWRRPTCCA